MLVLFLLGKKGKLSGNKIYEEAKKEADCSGRRPEHKSSIYRSIKKLVEKGYLEEVEKREVRGTLEKFYSLTKRGQKKYPGIRDQFHIWELVPDFDATSQKCLKCEASDVEDCWEICHEILEAVARRVLKKSYVSFKLSLLKKHFKTPGELTEFTYWLNMLLVPRKTLREKFESQIQVLGLDHLLIST